MPEGFVLLSLTIAGSVLGAVLWRERQERRAIERALFHEVDALRWQAMAMAAEIARRYRAGEPFDAAFFAMWRLSEPLIYPGAGAAVGRLRGEALDRVGAFHAQLADARARLAEARAAACFEPSPYRMLSCLVRASNHVQPWLEGLQARLGRVPGDAPDTDDANALLGEFEDAAEEPLAVVYCWADCAHP